MNLKQTLHRVGDEEDDKQTLHRVGDEEDDQDGLAAHRTESTTLATEKRHFEVEDKAFWDVYATLSQKQLNANATVRSRTSRQ